MQVIIQRVSSASLKIAASSPKQIDKGIVALVGVEKGDAAENVKRMAERLLSYRIFPDQEGRMNLSLSDINGGLLLIPNFTVAADTRKGTRAGFSSAAKPDDASHLFHQLATIIEKQCDKLETGIFAADMQVSLTNDGPVTFILNS